MAKNKEQIERHVKQWMHNRALIGQVPKTHPDWVVTIVFYAAVQAIDAALAFDGVSVSNHDGRFKAIAATNRLLKVGTLYHPLYDLCRKVRYTADPNQWVPPSLIEKRIINGYLLPLERSVSGLIGRSAPADPIILSWNVDNASVAAPAHEKTPPVGGV